MSFMLSLFFINYTNLRNYLYYFNPIVNLLDILIILSNLNPFILNFYKDFNLL
jgi:hypothetical protein